MFFWPETMVASFILWCYYPKCFSIILENSSLWCFIIIVYIVIFSKCMLIFQFSYEKKHILLSLLLRHYPYQNLLLVLNILKAKFLNLTCNKNLDLNPFPAWKVVWILELGWFLAHYFIDLTSCIFCYWIYVSCIRINLIFSWLYSTLGLTRQTYSYEYNNKLLPSFSRRKKRSVIKIK